jgi:hypothetical protein
MPMPPPGSFFGVPSLVSNGENYWLIKGIKEKIRQIKDNLFETENCCRPPPKFAKKSPQH